jgi:hypothetical protein
MTIMAFLKRHMRLLTQLWEVLFSPIQWERAPYARYCHPREDHLLPLLVCQSLAGGVADLIFDDKIIERRAVAFHWS